MLNENILVVEDDTQIRSFISYALQQDNYKCITTGTAQGALSIIVSEPIDLILLDLGLPDFDGIEVIKKVREWSQTPIIVISARDQDKEKATALDTGADDYLTKPFSTTELMARIRVALRHTYRNERLEMKPVLSVSSLSIDLEKRLAFLGGEEIHLTPLEYNLLALFFKNVGKVLTSSYIIKEIWGVAYGNDTQSLRGLMSGLRRKIEQNPGNPQYIITEIGVGYRLKGE